MKLVDLGASEVIGSWELGNSRVAIGHWESSRHWRITRTPKRLVLIEGQPDRHPALGESIEDWLIGRAGSFRGFEIEEPAETAYAKVRVFTDPLGTRPVYFLVSRDRVCISDKLSTVVLNSPSGAEPDWGGLLEAAVLGTLYSDKTTVKDAVLLVPGEALEFEGRTLVRRWKNTLPLDASFTAGEVMARPAETLRFALEKAIGETWTDPEIRLLLSGGLDSRILLTLAPGPRKALTVQLYSRETDITQQVAEVAGADLEVVPVPDYEFPLRWAYLVTGASHDPKFLTHLGLVQNWRKQGISGITHGYFHNTLYRSWAAGPVRRYPNQSSPFFEWMGRNGYYLDRYGCRPANLPRQFYELLSEEGKIVLHRQFRELSDSLISVIVDGYDLTFERRLMGFVARQIYFAGMLAWYEGVDVVSPVFQPSLWTWYTFSHPRDRERDWAIREIFLSLEHPAAKLPDSNTGRPIAHLKIDWRDRIRNQFWYPTFRAIYQSLFHQPQPYPESAMRWGSRFRELGTLAALEDGVSVLRDNPLFDRSRVQVALDAYRGGDNQFVDAICALAKFGQWQRLVTRPESQTEHVLLMGTGQAKEGTRGVSIN
ncbi:MAG: hypothetical protein JO033_01440 [Acidobacteriaceae bacterium]|nr:hypothetical protein [Acidobacteriaceae bacterium]MBV9500985.1 hypothetical protein [Acidobacteriaceae bacterium]